MQDLIDADLPRAAADVLRRLGHEPVDVRDIGLGGAEDPLVADHAQRHGLCLVTGDFDFSDIRNYPPDQYPGIIVLVIPPNATRVYALQLLESFVQDASLLALVPRRLAIVEPGRVRFRPALP